MSVAAIRVVVRTSILIRSTRPGTLAGSVVIHIRINCRLFAARRTGCCIRRRCGVCSHRTGRSGRRRSCARSSCTAHSVRTGLTRDARGRIDSSRLWRRSGLRRDIPRPRVGGSSSHAGGATCTRLWSYRGTDGPSCAAGSGLGSNLTHRVIETSCSFRSRRGHASSRSSAGSVVDYGGAGGRISGRAWSCGGCSGRIVGS
jgi:hypothetical protein